MSDITVKSVDQFDSPNGGGFCRARAGLGVECLRHAGREFPAELRALPRARPQRGRAGGGLHGALRVRDAARGRRTATSSCPARSPASAPASRAASRPATSRCSCLPSAGRPGSPTAPRRSPRTARRCRAEPRRAALRAGGVPALSDAGPGGPSCDRQMCRSVRGGDLLQRFGGHAGRSPLGASPVCARPPVVDALVDRTDVGRSRLGTGAANQAWIAYLVLAGAGAAVYLFGPVLQGSGPLFNVLSGSSVIAILVGIRIHRPAASWVWRWFAIAQGLFFLGDVYTYTYPVLIGHDVPFPSPGGRVLHPGLPGTDDRHAARGTPAQSAGGSGRSDRRADRHLGCRPLLLDLPDRALRARCVAHAAREGSVDRLSAG